MKSVFFLLLSWLLASEAVSQPIYGKAFVEFDVRVDTILTKVSVSENVPQDTALRKDMMQKINTAFLSKEIKKGIYTVVVQFVTDKDGNISDVKPLTTLGYGLEAEAVRIIKKRTKWVPATQNGSVVIVYEQLDIEITREKKPEKVYAKVKIKYPLPGADYSWTQTLEEKLNQSMKIDKRVKKGKHLLTVSYRAMRDSTFGEIRCLNNPAYNIYDEVLKVLSTYKKTWPATAVHSVAGNEACLLFHKEYILKEVNPHTYR